MYSRFGKVFHFLSILIFLVVFLYIYALLPQTVAYEIDPAGYTIQRGSRDGFFFMGMGLFLLSNLLILFPAKLIERQSVKNWRKLFPAGDPVSDNVLSWLYSFTGIINICIAILAYYIFRINEVEGTITGGSVILFYSIPVLLLVWVLALFVVMGQKIKQVQKA